MRILFDQATPLPIRPYLKGHQVRTAAQQGWDKLKNGELLVAAEADGFEVLLTTDKNMRYQQNLAGRKIAVVILGLQQWPSLQPHVHLVVEAVHRAVPGSYTEIELPLEPRSDRSEHGS
jgi:predicted nuclease of predicted toxin-antitoxin system